MYKFTNFCEKANRALNSAIETAENLGHTYIGSEHLLMGIVREDNGLGTQVLLSKGVNYQKIENVVRNIIGVGIPTVLTPEDFSPRSKHIIEASVSLYKSTLSPYISTEHILLSLLRETDCCALRILKELSLTPDEIISSFASDSNSKSSVFSSHEPKHSKIKTPNLDNYGHDLVKKAKAGEIDPVIARDKEIERVIQILLRRSKNNPCLIGEPGVGKTAVLEGLALKIANADVPELLLSKRIISLDLTSMVAGTKYRGDFEERIKNCINEVVKAGDVILFVDEMHNLIGTGSAEGAVDAANILKPSLARREIQVIGATTLEEYRKYIEKDSALERRFQSVKVEEPTEKECIRILEGLKEKYESHHKVKITHSAIEAAVKMSVRYISDRFLPDKAIDLLDEAASKVRLVAFSPPDEVKQIEEELKQTNDEKARAINYQDFETAARLRDKEKSIRNNLNTARANWKEKAQSLAGEVTEKEIALIVSSWTGIPVKELTKEESSRLLDMEKILSERIVGQKKAVSALSKAIRLGRSGLKDPGKPLGSFIFLGPTGVGKTEICKALGAAVFGDENSVIRFDMSEFMEKHSVSRLSGSPPGYVGYDDGGQLTEKVRRKPYSVILFDEIEKAHPDIFNSLLQILDDGIMTDSQGRRVDFKNALIIMTSNVGARLISGDNKSIGFESEEDTTFEKGRTKTAVMKELKNTFRPEFLNRIDEIIIFSKLTKEEIKEIAKRLLKKTEERLSEIDIAMTFSDEVSEIISKKGFDPVYGARPLKRAIRTKIEDPLSEKILEGKVKAGRSYICKAKNEKIIFEEA